MKNKRIMGKQITVLALIAVVVMIMAGCAPAWASKAPTAYIDLIKPTAVSAGQTVHFEGHGTDADGEVVGYQWTSSIDGILSKKSFYETSSLSAGEHIINFKVQDNNGNWSAEVKDMVVVSAPEAASAEEDSEPVINTFNASPAIIDAGEPSTLHWDVTGAETITIDMQIGSVGLTGSRTIFPAATTTYTLTATNSAGVATATAQVIVSEIQPVSLPVINLFNASPEIITSGESSTLNWSVSGADAIHIDHGIGTVALAGTYPVSPAASTIYTLTAINMAGTSTSSVQVIVVMPPPSEKPDLVIKDIWRSGSIIYYKIANQSITPAGPSVTELVIDGIVKASDQAGPLAPGASATYSFGYSYSGTIPTDTVTVRADKDDAVDESNESNNAYTETWILLTPTPQPLPNPTPIPTPIPGPILLKPDLVIKDIWRSGNKIHYTIKNQGSKVAIASTSKLIVNGIEKDTDQVVLLAPGASSDESFSYTLPFFPINYQVEVYADSPDSINESNEGNNMRSEWL